VIAVAKRSVVIVGRTADLEGIPSTLGERLDRSVVATASLDRLVTFLEERRPAAVVVTPDGPDGTTAVAVVRDHRPDVPILAPLPDDQRSLFGARTSPLPESPTARSVADWLQSSGAVSGAADRIEPADGTRRLDRLQTTVERLLSADDVETVGDVAVTAALEVFDLPAAGVHLLNDDGSALEPITYTDGAADLFDGEPPTYEPGTQAWSVYETGDPLVLENTAEADIDETPTRSALVLPLSDHGLFVCSSSTAREFSDADESVANVLAAATAAALDLLAQADRVDRREVELRRERERLAGLFRTAPIPVTSVRITDDLGAVVEDVNPAFESTFGYDASEIVGENLDDYIIPERDLGDVEALNRRVDAGQPFATEVKRETADGLRDFHLSVSAIANDLTYAFYVDITERKQRQQRLQVLSRVLRHDIRNQMNVIEGNAGLLAEGIDDPDLAERAAGIRRSAAQLTSLSRKTRRVERLVAQEMLNAETDLVRIVSRQLSSFRDHSDAIVTADLPETAMVQGGDALAVVVEELLDNAAEHNDADRTRIGVEVTTATDYATVSVWDNGSGLPSEEQSVLRGESEPTQLEHTSGIGLWMVKWVVETVGGRLVLGAAGEGTEIGVRIPRHRSDDESVVRRDGDRTD